MQPALVNQRQQRDQPSRRLAFAVGCNQNFREQIPVGQLRRVREWLRHSPVYHCLFCHSRTRSDASAQDLSRSKSKTPRSLHRPLAAAISRPIECRSRCEKVCAGKPVKNFLAACLILMAQDLCHRPGGKRAASWRARPTPNSIREGGNVTTAPVAKSSATNTDTTTIARPARNSHRPR